jgi:hypothetical protein
MDLIVGPVLSFAIGALMSTTTAYAYRYLNQRRPLRQLYKFENGSDVIVIASSLPYEDPDEYFNYTTAIDGVLCYKGLMDVFNILSFDSGKVKFYLSEGISDAAVLDKHIILVGGRENNQISEKFNQIAERRFYFDQNTIVDSQKIVPAIHPEIRNGEIVKDYCLITRTRNIFSNNPDDVIITFEGIRHFGTIAGVEFSHPRYLKSVLKNHRIGEYEHVQLIISVQVAQLGQPGFKTFNLSERQLEFWHFQ